MTNKKIDYYGVSSTRHDVLLDEYEFGMTVADYDPLFAGFEREIGAIVGEDYGSEEG